MSVQIANCRLAVSRVEPDGYDTHGAPIPGGPGQPTAALPGKRTEGTDGSWQLALDPSLWPVRVHDFVLSDDGQVWLVLSCQLIRTPDVSDLPEHLAEQLDVSFVRVTGAERTGAFTEPGGGEFVGR